ncbi:MAG: 3TM-type holin [Pseudomonadota bacterium]|nr:3TM-type holin [Pseudomonadota bacterium]
MGTIAPAARRSGVTEMAFPLLVQLGLAAAPHIIDFFDGDENKVSDAVRDIGGALTGKTGDKEIADAIQADPMLLMQLQSELNRHAADMKAKEVDQLREINKTIRAEAASSDPYVRRMRPTFGYIMAVSWAGQMGAISYVIATDPVNAGAVIAAVASLGTIWTVGLSVLGIYVYKRSEEKTAGGEKGFGILGALAKRIAG